MEIGQVSPSSTGIAPAPGAGAAAVLRAAVPAQAQPAPPSADAVELSDAAKAAGAEAGAAPAPPSAVKSLAYGALGLQSPEEEKKQTDTYYTAGRYLAAAATAGAFLSLIL